MPSILILTDSFTPDFSPRVSCLVRNLIKDGYSVTVLAEDVENPFYGIDVTGAEVYSYKFYSSKPKTFIRQIEWAFKATLNLVFDYKSYWFHKKWTKDLKGRKFDAVLCSTFCYFPLKCAWKIAGRMGVPFIADIRDLSEQFASLEYQQHKIPLFGYLYDRVMRIRRNRYIRKASSVITVSPWHKEFLENLNGNVSLIYNGYDSPMFHYEDVKSKTFDILYTGKWLGCDMQDPQLLFTAIDQLVSEGSLSADKIRLIWYLSSGRGDLEKLLAAYPVSRSISIFESRVQYSEIPSIIQKSSIVLVLSNKLSEKGPKGIITTKFFEALGCQKPVVNVVSDRSYLASIIDVTNAGISAVAVEEVKNFILDKYNEWSVNGFTHQAVNTTESAKFDRVNQARAFEAEMEGVIIEKKHA